MSVRPLAQFWVCIGHHFDAADVPCFYGSHLIKIEQLDYTFVFSREILSLIWTIQFWLDFDQMDIIIMAHHAAIIFVAATASCTMMHVEPWDFSIYSKNKIKRDF